MGEVKRDKQAHMILAQHKNQYRAEITLNFLDHQLVGEHADSDQFTAINMAIEKLEKQIDQGSGQTSRHQEGAS